MKRTNENIVTSFLFYMWNAWCKNECKTVFGDMSEHFWEKWCSLCNPTASGAAEKFYSYLSDDNKQLLVERAVALYDGRGTRAEEPEKEILVCDECGSEDIEIQAWVNANTDEFISNIDEGDRWCDTCEENVCFCTKKEFEERMEAWWGDTDFPTMEKVTGYRQDDFSPNEGYQDFVDACNRWWEAKSYNEKREIYNEKGYTVFVGGVEVNDYYLSHEEAERLAGEYCEDGYTDVNVIKA